MCIATTAAAAGAGAAAAGAAATTSTMSVWSAIGTAISAIGSVMQYAQQQQQAENAKKIAEYNATVSEVKAMEAREKGGVEANEKRQEVKKMLAAQSTQMAANGGDIATGSNLNIFGDTAWQGEKDAKTIELNALREAYGYESEAKSQRMSGGAAASNYQAQSYGSLLTGATTVAKGIGSYYDSKSSAAKTNTTAKGK